MTKVHYIDVGKMTPRQAEKFIERLKQKYKKKRIQAK